MNCSPGSLLVVTVLTNKIYPQIIFGGASNERRLGSRAFFCEESSLPLQTLFQSTLPMVVLKEAFSKLFGRAALNFNLPNLSLQST
jgi:hypothetical protein